MHPKPSTLPFIFVLLLLTLTSCVSLAEDVTPPPGYQAPTAPNSTPTPIGPVFPILPSDPARGAPLYAENCAPCHGKTGLGDGEDAEMLANPVPPLGDPALAQQAVPQDWYLMVTNGNMANFMPPFKSLSVSERWDVIAYAATLSSPKEEVARGGELYDEKCIVCHGERGKGDGPEAGSLSVSPIDFTDQEFMGTRSEADLFESITDGLGEMHSFLEIPEGDRWALTSYLRTLSFSATSLESDPPAPSEDQQNPEITPLPEENEEAVIDQESDDIVDSSLGTVYIEAVSAAGDFLPVDMQVTLYNYENMAQIYSKTLTLPAEGTAAVENVPMRPEQVIFVTSEHKGVLYGSDIFVIEEGMREATLIIPYYEPTSDLSVLQADRLHIFFDLISEESVEVFVLYIFSNTSDQVLASETAEEPVLVFNLPEGATNLQRDTGMEFQDVDLPNGFGLQTVYPSSEQYQILYSFEMPYQKNKLDFDLPIALDSSAVIVMIPESGLELESDQLVDAGMRDIEGVSYSMYNGSNLQAGDKLWMEVSGKPKLSSPTGETQTATDTASTGLVIGLAAFGLTLIGAGVYLWWKNRINEDEWLEVEPDQVSDLIQNNDPDDLMDAIITLDDLYQAGDIPEAAYQERRAELKERLQDLLGN